MDRRGSGILLPVTSLPSPFGVGDLGPWAYRFADFLAEAGQRYWQILPLNPTDPEHGNSPYHSCSAFAGNPLLVSPELLLRDGLLDAEDLASPPGFPAAGVDYRPVGTYKADLLRRAADRYSAGRGGQEFERFCRGQAGWLENHALFVALKTHLGGRDWTSWPAEFRDRRTEALERARQELADSVTREKLRQFFFFSQWQALRGHCRERGIRIIGDLPIYVVHDSVDVWARPELFKLDEHKRPSVVAGVPPDYFSETGQRWGNPVYRWDLLREQGYDFWIERVRHNLALFDWVRLDHFRGFVAFWEIPAAEATAVNGRWVEAPAVDFFTCLKEAVSPLAIIAEDLGIITPDVVEVMRRFGFPGMKILLFAFGEDLATNPYAPHNHVRHCVVYTGTHDNNTVRGWFENEAPPETRARLASYLGREIGPAEVSREMARLAMTSVADTVILPMQDLLGLGAEARMNRPASQRGNWQWRLLPEQLTPALAGRLREMTRICGRV